MKVRSQHINIVTNLPIEQSSQIADIFLHCQKGYMFAIYTKDRDLHIVYDPKSLSAAFSTGEFFTYINQEAFIDSIKLATIEYTEFMSLAKVKLEKPKPKITIHEK